MIWWVWFHFHLENALLYVLSTIDDVSDDEDDADEHEGDEGGVAQVLPVDLCVAIVEFQAGRGKENVVSVVSMPCRGNFIKTTTRAEFQWNY